MFAINKSVSKLRALSKNKSIEGTSDETKKVKNKKSKSAKRLQLTQKGQSVGLTKGVVMMSNIPHGFYEKQMFDYLSQFGKVLRLRISRNRKTGKRRNYGFIEFECEEVAKIVANTMNNYLMFDHILKCEVIPKSKLKEKPNLLKNWNKEFVSSTHIHKSLHNRNKSIEREFRLTKNRLKKVRQMEGLLKSKAIDFKCEVINLPDMARIRQEVAIEAEKAKELDIKSKSSAKLVTIPKRKAVETVQIVKKRGLSKTEGSKRLKRAVFPKLHQFSVLLSANKRKSRNSYLK